MSFSVVITSLVGAVALAGFWTYQRREQKEILQFGRSFFAIVVEYRAEDVQVAGEWTRLDYPYVIYENEPGTYRTQRLKYAHSGKQQLAVDELIEVVRFDNVLYYRPALENRNLPLAVAAAGLFLFGLLSLIPGFNRWLDF